MDCEGSMEAGTCLCFFLFESFETLLQGQGPAIDWIFQYFGHISDFLSIERVWVTNLLLQFVKQIAYYCDIRHFVDLTSMRALQFS